MPAGLLRQASRTFRATVLPISFVAPVFLWCTAPPPLSMETLPRPLASLAPIDSICSFKAFGDMKFSLRGQRRTVKIDVIWRGDSNFTIALYSPFGGAVASASASSSGAWNINAGDSVLQKRPREKVSVGGMLDYSLTFEEFLRAATGRLLDTTVKATPADSLILKGKEAFLMWREDSAAGRPFDITATLDRKHFSVTDVIYSKKGLDVWELAVSRSRKGAPEEIRFKDGNNNYFYLKYSAVVIERGRNCRSERL
jgi:hypothetical protein